MTLTQKANWLRKNMGAKTTLSAEDTIFVNNVLDTADNTFLQQIANMDIKFLSSLASIRLKNKCK